MKIYYDDKLKDYVYSAGVPEWRVIKVEPKEDFTLLLSFAKGEVKKFDFKPLLSDWCYEPIRNIEMFKKAYLECDTVVWNDEIDIAPEYLYENSIPVEEAQ